MLKRGDPVPARLLPDPAEAMRERLNPKLRIAEALLESPDGSPWPRQMSEDGSEPEKIGGRYKK